MGRVMVAAALMAAVVLAGCASPPMPDVVSASTMPITQRTVEIPAGFASFCLRYADQCQTNPGAPTVVSLNENTWRVLSRINREVNNAIWPQDDLTHYGRAEYWTIPTDGRGDCDDYAVTKRKFLGDAGVPAAALRLAVVISPRAGRHAVLTVATDKGDFVLDNLTDDIVAWNATDFTWIERQDAANPSKWVALRPIMTANATGDTVLSVKPDGVTASLPLVISPPDSVPAATSVRTAGLSD